MKTHTEPTAYGYLGYWNVAYAGMLYCEYYLASGDKRLLPRIRAALGWIETGINTSRYKLKALGHGPAGLPYKEGSLIAPTVHAMVFTALARRCGVRSSLWRTLEPYLLHAWSDPRRGGHGGMGYNPSAKDRNEFWSRSAMMAQSCKLRGKHPRLIQAVVDIMSKRHPWFRYSHAYGEPGGAWGLIALGHLDARTYRKVMQAYRWWFALSWEPGYGLRYTTPHEGSPLGQDELFNNVYALVLRADRATLQITGAKEVRWIKRLRRTALATPVSIRRGKDGRVTLEPAIPGSPVRFTLDGKEPSASSWLYKKPFALPRGGKVTARSYSLAGKPGKTSARLFGPAKTRWRVIDASGDRDPKMALKRAELAIDDNPALPWRVDVGFESATFPHHLAIDLGGKQLMAGLALHFVQKKKAIKQYELQSSKDGKRWVTVAKGTFESYKERCEIRLRRVLATRYIKLIALSGTGLPTAEGGGLAIYELDLLLPAR